MAAALKLLRTQDDVAQIQKRQHGGYNNEDIHAAPPPSRSMISNAVHNSANVATPNPSMTIPNMSMISEGNIPCGKYRKSGIKCVSKVEPVASKFCQDRGRCDYGDLDARMARLRVVSTRYQISRREYQDFIKIDGDCGRQA